MDRAARADPPAEEAPEHQSHSERDERQQSEREDRVRARQVMEEDQRAKVVWDATVHTEFSWRGKRRTPGETITLTARLVRVEGLWKLVQLHEGDDDDPQSHDAPAN